MSPMSTTSTMQPARRRHYVLAKDWISASQVRNDLRCNGIPIGDVVYQPSANALWRAKPEETTLVLSPDVRENPDFAKLKEPIDWLIYEGAGVEPIPPRPFPADASTTTYQDLCNRKMGEWGAILKQIPEMAAKALEENAVSEEPQYKQLFLGGVFDGGSLPGPKSGTPGDEIRIIDGVTTEYYRLEQFSVLGRHIFVWVRMADWNDRMMAFRNYLLKNLLEV